MSRTGATPGETINRLHRDPSGYAAHGESGVMSANGVILVVDDNPENLELLIPILTADGYQVLPANSGELALAAVAARPPDLVLLDIRMPGLDGFEVCRRLKADPSSRDIPIMFMSAFGDSAERVRGFELGAVDFVSKPFQPEELRARVRTHTDLHHAQLKLQESHDLIAKLAAQVPGTIYQYRLHPDGRSSFPFSSPGMMDIWEVTPDQVREDATPVLSRLHPEDAERVSEAILESARTLAPFHCEFRVVLPRQGLCWRLSDARPERMEDGGTLWHGIISDMTVWKEAEETLRLSLREKEGLLKEVHHRVKNNLQVVTSLLRLETSRSAVPDTRRVLSDMQGRIMSMALLHETLYRSGRFGQVDLSAYLLQLAQQMFRANSTPGAARLETDLSPVQVSIDQAIPCGLILNELLTNSLKHAFVEGQGGEVRVTLRHGADDVVCLAVTDSGAGLPEDFDVRRSKSLGMQLVSDLARQLGGRLEVGPGPGARFSVFFTPTAQSHRPDPL